ncbi:transaldolase [Pediococcus acidilactici]|uniref:transaldolase family protein n=1 Tax=Pediococcus acidilactici TaxID=1254 RepID=UPI001324831D|nr:transaldolase family protein [Pediococcus acidilactici]KAF0363637.1 transaldolase [Pediococcus acidilactici]KAF0367393.1 transaldolase [Pediococcus acidilactici]KAF0417938.1 transaldolase [Pediococcus acidilactici]KAF0421226.1 transaldolase [Pediococcus acidilactici]KAF0473895.1 transaldolase [Pediococcus acidilactici]
MNTLKIKIYADGANIEEIRKVSKFKFVNGFTTNPTLLKKAGVTDYLSFAKSLVDEFPEKDISFEVFSNDYENMIVEAKKLHDLGENVYVKVPIVTSDGDSTEEVIKRLSSLNINLNVTAITTYEQVKIAEESFARNTQNLVSIFIGRLTDNRIDPTNFIKESVDFTKEHPEAKLLWASTREVYNVVEADKFGLDVITVPPTLLEKLNNKAKTDLEISIDTVKGFEKDIKNSGLHIL